MKILYIHQYFAIPAGGGATRSYEMARRMVKLGHQVTILTSSAFLPKMYAPDKGWNSFVIDGISVEVLNLSYSNKMSFWKRIIRFIQFLIRVSLRGRKLDGDVVFATSTPLTVAIPAVLTAHKKKIPMVFEVRDLWPELPIAIGALKNPVIIGIARWLERFAYANSIRVIALSPGMVRGVVESGYPDKRVSMIPNGCDIGLFSVGDEERNDFLKNHPYLDGHQLVVYTGTLGKINGVSYLVDIAQELCKKTVGTKFVIAGDGFDSEKIKNQAEKAGLLDKTVFLLPPLSKRQVACLLSSASVATSLFINLPEMWKNSANKFFDALAAGKPIMINYGGWQADLLKRSGAGIIIPPDNPQIAADILFDFLNDQERLYSCAVASRDLAKNVFNRDLLAEKLLDILQLSIHEYKRT